MTEFMAFVAFVIWVAFMLLALGILFIVWRDLL